MGSKFDPLLGQLRTTDVSSGGGTGTVTSVSVVTANGVSATVATPTTTPAITVALGAITPTSVASTGAVTGTNLSGTNTGDQTNVTGTAGTITGVIPESQVTNLVTDLSAKQPTLVSGTSIKTINGISILGSGNLLADKTYTQSFTSVATITVPHNIGKYPAITVMDSAGSECVGTVVHTDINNLTITFSASFSGVVSCN